MANSKGIALVGLIDKDVDKLRDHIDLAIYFDYKKSARIMEIHTFIIHIICLFIEEKLCIS
jgi:phosphoheptose isomerase